jgi:hypothetical protein
MRQSGPVAAASPCFSSAAHLAERDGRGHPAGTSGRSRSRHVAARRPDQRAVAQSPRNSSVRGRPARRAHSAGDEEGAALGGPASTPPWPRSASSTSPAWRGRSPWLRSGPAGRVRCRASPPIAGIDRKAGIVGKAPAGRRRSPPRCALSVGVPGEGRRRSPPAPADSSSPADTASMPNGATSSSRISKQLALALWLATTSFGSVMRRCAADRGVHGVVLRRSRASAARPGLRDAAGVRASSKVSRNRLLAERRASPPCPAPRRCRPHRS